jgi:hypothetical protein
MKAALVALVLLGGIFVGYSATATVSLDGQTVSCQADGGVGADETSPTTPTADVAAPACTGLG